MTTLTDAESRQAFEKVWHDSPETGLGAESLRWGAWSEPDKADLKECAWKLWQAALESRLAVGQPVAQDNGRALYVKWTDEQGIHSNRFPSWAELTQPERDEFSAKAAREAGVSP